MAHSISSRCSRIQSLNGVLCRHLRTTTAIISASVMGGAIMVTPALAQTPGQAQQTQDARSSILEEVVVTAQKREQNLQDVGISVTAFTGDQLSKLGVRQSVDIAAFTPGVHTSGAIAGQNTQFTIRGVTQTDFNDIVEAPNAVYLDEGYLAVAQAQTFAVFDIDRVEILKGPQGTLFGRNATGGLVHYISRKPTFDRVEGYLDATAGLFDSENTAESFRLEGAIGGPISDNLAARAAFSYNWHDGYLKNLYPLDAVGAPPGPGAGADLADDDTLAGRFTVMYDNHEDFRTTLSFNGARTRMSTAPYMSKPTIGVFEDVNGQPELVNTIDVDPGEIRASIAPDGSDFGSDLDNDGVFGDSFGRPLAGGDFFGYIDPCGEDFCFSGDFAFNNANSVDTWGVNGRIEWDLSDSMTVTSVTDFKQYDKLLLMDVDAAPANQSVNYAAVDAQSLTQELRVNGTTEAMRWVVGLYYIHIDSESKNGLKFPSGSVVPGAPFDLGTDARLKTNSYSVFGQVEYDITPQFTFVLGGRLMEEKKGYVMSQGLYFHPDSLNVHVGTPVPIGPDFVNGVPSAFNDSNSTTLWAGKAQVEFRPNDDLLVYVGANRGVKAGSYNAQIAGGLPVPVDAIPYDEEILYSYEGGFKTSLGQFTRLNASVFYYDYKGYQSFLFTGVSGVVINADARTYGAEVELQTTPMDGLDIILGASWFDAVVKDVPLRVDGPISRDVKPTYAPEFQLNGMVRYEWDMFGGYMAASSDFAYSDSYFYNLRNFDADKFSSYFMVNARLGWTTADERWEVAGIVRNITDERAGVQGFNLATLCGCNELSFQPPRWFGIQVRHNL